MTQVIETTNPAAVGYTILTDDSSPIGVTFLGGGVYMAFQHDGKWSRPTHVVRPERFGPVPTGGTPTKADRQAGRAWCEAFASA